MPEFQFAVGGKPIPQGSKNGYVRGGRVVLVEAQKDLPEYRSWVAACASDEAVRQGWVKPDRDTPIEITIGFSIRKPQSVRRLFPTTPPDLDKLIRAVLDAITKAENVWHDDAQVTRITAYKMYETEYATVVRVSCQ